MLCVLWEFWSHFKFVKENRALDEKPLCGRSLGVATDRQGAGDTTGRERFDDSASV